MTPIQVGDEVRCICGGAIHDDGDDPLADGRDRMPGDHCWAHDETGLHACDPDDLYGQKARPAAGTVTVPAPGTPCPRGCTFGYPRHKEPELLTVNEDGEVSCPTCWECFGIVDVEAVTPAPGEGET